MFRSVLLVLVVLSFSACDKYNNKKNDPRDTDPPVIFGEEIDKTGCHGGLIEVFDNTNRNIVGNNGTSPTFNVPLSNGYDQTYCLEKIYTYHWNGGNGDVPGKLGIEVRGTQKRWNATATDSPAGDKNVDWNVTINELIILRNSAGPYKVLDSHQGSWSKNAGSQNKGFAKVWVSLYPDL